MFNLRSFYCGIRAMYPSTSYPQAKWSVELGWYRRPWCHLWTPIWHDGRGPYVSIGLGVVRICRGY